MSINNAIYIYKQYDVVTGKYSGIEKCNAKTYGGIFLLRDS